MPRFTLQFWVCNLPCGTRNPPEARQCVRCGANHYERYAVVRSAERAMIDVAPDGTIGIPGRIDTPLHPKQIAAGVRRVEVESATAGQYSLKHLEQLGLVHEATNWNSEGANLSVKHEELPDLTPKPWQQILAEPDAF